ncbi:outer membrane protein [Legionella spiritensis]|uniref:Uncharacterized protein n=1 Tax=Legionella spiritensis TaxID=452 RepID=A0A0W0YYY2_LEGSP|nr:outer membrane beta-barrel protein [Legionella spiritensis]KTD61838.1 hypothetical protein Lspi_2468 [Legionella spiritensis]SNV31614.1 Uncharacterised protein [Legionella spiritensis]
MSYVSRLVAIFITLFVYQLSFSNSGLPSEQSKGTFSRNNVITLSLGYDRIKAGEAQSVVLLPPFANYYTASSSRRSVIMGGLFVGKEYWKTPYWGLQIGLGGYLDAATNVGGTIWQFGLPEFANLNYNYRIQSERLVVEGKVLTTLKQIIHPYLSGSLGISRNKAYSYEEKPLFSEAMPMVAFADNRQTSFTYSAGAGLEVALCRFLRLGAGYQYVRLGDFSLNPSPVQETGQSLSLSQADSHEIRIQLSFVV